MCFSLKPDLDFCGAGSGQQQCRTLPCAPRCNVSASVTATAGRVSVSRLMLGIESEKFGFKNLICKELGDKYAEVMFTFSRPLIILCWKLEAKL